MCEIRKCYGEQGQRIVRDENREWEYLEREKVSMDVVVIGSAIAFSFRRLFDMHHSLVGPCRCGRWIRGSSAGCWCEVRHVG